jgi:tryptophanyl-tRNA synthetase
VHDRRDYYLRRPEEVRAIIENGNARASRIARQTMEEVREAVGI